MPPILPWPQTAIAGGAELICTVDTDFYEPAITRFLSQAGTIRVLDDVALMQLLRTSGSDENA